MRCPMPDFERRVRNLDHALWRVNFLASILQTHRTLSPRDADWRRQEAEYVERLAWAERELERWRTMKKGDAQQEKHRSPPPPKLQQHSHSQAHTHSMSTG